jgi:hypothetical protein
MKIGRERRGPGAVQIEREREREREREESIRAGKKVRWRKR